VPREIAFATLPGGDDSASLELHFFAFSDLSSAQIQRLVSQKKWEQALLATSKNGLAPQSSELAAPYFKAMYYLHLSLLINPDDPGLAQVRTDAEHYFAESGPPCGEGKSTDLIGHPNAVVTSGA
jgi:hypothetical protein